MRFPPLLALPLLLAACAEDAAVSRTASSPCEAAPLVNADTASAPGILPARPEAMANRGRRGVRVQGEALNRALLVTEVAAARNGDGTAEVSITIASCGFLPVQVLSQVSFLDAAGRAIETQGAAPLALGPGAQGVGLRWRSASRPASFLVELTEQPRR